MSLKTQVGSRQLAIYDERMRWRVLLGVVTKILCGCMVVLLAAPAWARPEVRVVGSDLLAPTLAPALSDFSQNNVLKLTVDLEGSRDAWLDLEAGEADVGVMSFAPGMAAPGDPFVAIPVAYHVAVVLAPAGLSLSQISFPQLAGVFGQGKTPAQRRWAALGVTGVQATGRVVPWVFAPPHDLVRALFSHEVLRDGPLRDDLGVDESMSALMEHLSSGTDGMGLAPLPPTDELRLKVLAVSSEPGGVAYAPTALNVDRGDYPLRWPVYVVFRRTETKRLYSLLRFLLGDECAELYRQAWLLPAPAEKRSGAVFDLEQL